MTRTLPELFVPVAQAITGAHLVAWDGCHKIYLAMDEEEAEEFAGSYPHVVEADAETMLQTVIDWYERSCCLRFVQAVSTNTEDPNLGYVTLIDQGADEDDIEDDDEDYED